MSTPLDRKARLDALKAKRLGIINEFEQGFDSGQSNTYAALPSFDEIDAESNRNTTLYHAGLEVLDNSERKRRIDEEHQTINAPKRYIPALPFPRPPPFPILPPHFLAPPQNFYGNVYQQRSFETMPAHDISNQYSAYQHTDVHNGNLYGNNPYMPFTAPQHSYTAEVNIHRHNHNGQYDIPKHTDTRPYRNGTGRGRFKQFQGRNQGSHSSKMQNKSGNQNLDVTRGYFNPSFVEDPWAHLM